MYADLALRASARLIRVQKPVGSGRSEEHDHGDIPLPLAGAAVGLHPHRHRHPTRGRGNVQRTRVCPRCCQIGPWRLANPLRHAARRAERAEDRPNVGLTVIVLKTSDQKNRLMRVVAPLGVLLPSGLGLKIDNQDVGRAGFVRCLPNGCVAEVVMDDTLIKQLRTGQTSTFIIFQTPEEGIGFPMSLKGFGEGYDLLP
jgi:hypothetical protein